MMYVRRDLLDMPLVGADDEPMGRVDGVIASYVAGRRLRLVCVELGAATLARRIHPRAERWTRAVARRLSPSRGRACRIPLSAIRTFGKRLRLKDDQSAWSALAWERWLRHKVVGRIPGH
ncbi:MAG TPA: hypothetical protein VIA61_12855 [Methylomirabilota bacterium]|jgi:hypothetical protein